MQKVGCMVPDIVVLRLCNPVACPPDGYRVHENRLNNLNSRAVFPFFLRFFSRFPGIFRCAVGVVLT